MGLPLLASKRNVIWVIMNGLTKSAHFLPIHDTWSTEKLAKLYVKDIVCPHGIPNDIIFDCNQMFQARFQQVLQKAFETKANFYSFYHPETNGQIE